MSIKLSVPEKATAITGNFKGSRKTWNYFICHTGIVVMLELELDFQEGLIITIYLDATPYVAYPHAQSLLYFLPRDHISELS